jgi:hypothetical protein
MRNSRCTTGINDIGGKTASITTTVANFATSFASFVDTGGKFATGVNVNPHQNDQGRKGPCYFQRLNALKCLKCQKI